MNLAGGDSADNRWSTSRATRIHVGIICFFLRAQDYSGFFSSVQSTATDERRRSWKISMFLDHRIKSFDKDVVGLGNWSRTGIYRLDRILKWLLYVSTIHIFLADGTETSYREHVGHFLSRKSLFTRKTERYEWYSKSSITGETNESKYFMQICSSSL